MLWWPWRGNRECSLPSLRSSSRCWAILVLCTHGLRSHQAPVPIDDTIELSEQEFEERSSRNVERWVSLHIIPVRGPTFIYENSTYAARISRNLTLRFHPARTWLLQKERQSPSRKLTKTPLYQTGNDFQLMTTSRSLERKKYIPLSSIPINANPTNSKATNGVLYVIDGTIQDD